MNICRMVQEKLVAAERLTAAEERHLGDCPRCRDINELHGALLAEAELPPPVEKRTDRRRRPRWLPALAGATALAGLAAVLLLARPAVDYGRAAEELSRLWDEVEQAKTAADLDVEERGVSGWLAMEMEKFDPGAEDAYWP